MKIGLTERFDIQLDRRWGGPWCAGRAAAALGRKRINGTYDFEGLRSKELPRDGKYKWTKGEERADGYVYGQKRPDGRYDYEVEYHAGPKDVEWFCQIDCNYLSRLEREGNLKAQEPAVCALRGLDRTRGKNVADIRAWWRGYIFPNGPNGKFYDEKVLGQLLEEAEKLSRSNDWDGILKREAQEVATVESEKNVKRRAAAPEPSAEARLKRLEERSIKREADLKRQAETLEKRENAVKGQEEATTKRSADLDARQKSLSERETTLSQQEAATKELIVDLDARQEAIASGKSELAQRSKNLAEQQEKRETELEQQAKTVAAERSRLEQQTKNLTEFQTGLSRQTKVLAEQRTGLEQATAAQRKAHEERLAELEQQTKILAGQHSKLEQQKTALLKRETELGQRESQLEQRSTALGHAADLRQQMKNFSQLRVELSQQIKTLTDQRLMPERTAVVRGADSEDVAALKQRISELEQAVSLRQAALELRNDSLREEQRFFINGLQTALERFIFSYLEKLREWKVDEELHDLYIQEAHAKQGIFEQSMAIGKHAVTGTLQAVGTAVKVSTGPLGAILLAVGNSTGQKSGTISKLFDGIAKRSEHTTQLKIINSGKDRIINRRNAVRILRLLNKHVAANSDSAVFATYIERLRKQDATDPGMNIEREITDAAARHLARYVAIHLYYRHAFLVHRIMFEARLEFINFLKQAISKRLFKLPDTNSALKQFLTAAFPYDPKGKIFLERRGRSDNKLRFLASIKKGVRYYLVDVFCHAPRLQIRWKRQRERVRAGLIRAQQQRLPLLSFVTKHNKPRKNSAKSYPFVLNILLGQLEGTAGFTPNGRDITAIGQLQQRVANIPGIAFSITRDALPLEDIINPGSEIGKMVVTEQETQSGINPHGSGIHQLLSLPNANTETGLMRGVATFFGLAKRRLVQDISASSLPAYREAKGDGSRATRIPAEEPRPQYYL